MPSRRSSAERSQPPQTTESAIAAGVRRLLSPRPRHGIEPSAAVKAAVGPYPPPSDLGLSGFADYSQERALSSTTSSSPAPPAAPPVRDLFDLLERTQSVLAGLKADKASTASAAPCAAYIKRRKDSLPEPDPEEAPSPGRVGKQQKEEEAYHRCEEEEDEDGTEDEEEEGQQRQPTFAEVLDFLSPEQRAELMFTTLDGDWNCTADDKSESNALSEHV